MSERIFRLVKEVIDKSKKSNVCIYGDNGSGKTTLLKEVHKALNNSIYIDSEDLIDEFENLGQINFQEKYTKYDYLLIDNISLLLPRLKVFSALNELEVKIISSSPIKLNFADAVFVLLNIKTQM